MLFLCEDQHAGRDGQNAEHNLAVIEAKVRYAEETEADQKQGERDGLTACVECGKRGELVRDLEDGAMKCARCCDIPA